MTAVTDFDDGGPLVSSVVTTVPFTTHSALADELLATGGVVSYKNKKKQTYRPKNLIQYVHIFN